MKLIELMPVLPKDDNVAWKLVCKPDNHFFGLFGMDDILYIPEECLYADVIGMEICDVDTLQISLDVDIKEL